MAIGVVFIAGGNELVNEFVKDEYKMHFFIDMKMIAQDISRWAKEKGKYQIISKVGGIGSQVKGMATAFR